MALKKSQLEASKPVVEERNNNFNSEISVDPEKALAFGPLNSRDRAPEFKSNPFQL
jgi:hypothetical protein